MLQVPAPAAGKERKGVCPYSQAMNFLRFPVGLLGNYEPFVGVCTLKISAGRCAVQCWCWCEPVRRVGTGSQANRRASGH